MVLWIRHRSQKCPLFCLLSSPRIAMYLGVPQNSMQRRTSDPKRKLLGQETQRQQQRHEPLAAPLVLPPLQHQLSPLKNNGGLPRMDLFFSVGKQGASREPQVMVSPFECTGSEHEILTIDRTTTACIFFGRQVHVGSASGQGTPY